MRSPLSVALAALPAKHSLILTSRATGSATTAIAKALSVSRRTVFNVCARHDDILAALRAHAAEIALRGIESAVEARLADACDAASPTGAESFHALLRFAGLDTAG